MVRTKKGILAGLALLTSLVGCGGGGGSADVNPGGGVPPALGPETVSAYCDTLYTTFATRYAACWKAPLAWASHLIDKTRLCPPVVNAVSYGHATYDRAAAGSCLSFFENATCTELRAIRDDAKYVADCRAAVVGNLPGMGYCQSDADCASGRCYTWTCPGRCYTGKAQGVSCSLDRDCAPGLYCYPGAPSASTCKSMDDRPANGATCTISTGCLPGLYCDGSTSSLQQGTCKPQVSSGACPTFAAAMAPGYGCFSGTTQPLLGPNEACSPGHCGPGQTCGPSATCVQDPVVGQTCPYYYSAYQDCIGGYCDSTLVCIASVPTTCYSDWDCESRGVCDSGCRAYCL